MTSLRTWRRRHVSATTFIAVMVTIELFIQLGQLLHHGGF